MKRVSLVLAMAAMLAGPAAMLALAKPEFSKREDKTCVYCHLSPIGGQRGFRGIYYGVHKKSFEVFIEAIEAAKAGVRANAVVKDAKPKKPYPPKGE